MSTSPAQLAANIANSRLSTGPVTADGKAASSRNHTSHGLFVSSLHSLPESDRALVQSIRAGFAEDFRAVLPGTTEAALTLDELAFTVFRIDRVRALQSAYLAARVDAIANSEDISLDDPARRIELEVRVLIEDDEKKSKVLDRLMKWERAFLRDRDRLLAAIRRSGEQRPGVEPTKMASKFPPAANPNSAASPSPQIPRNALCPCGSGQKYKRCCGHNAPPVLHHGAFNAVA